MLLSTYVNSKRLHSPSVIAITRIWFTRKDANGGWRQRWRGWESYQLQYAKLSSQSGQAIITNLVELQKVGSLPGYLTYSTS